MTSQLEIERLAVLPRPSADQTLLETVRQKGFETFPERLENFRRYQQGNRAEVLDYLPVILDIENVSRCNYRCSMCQVSRWPGNKRSEDMSFADFKALLDDQVGLLEIKLQGMGEPLLGGDTYFQMVRYARERHLWVRSTTNASLLHHNENYRKLIDADICEMQISIDGATQETFESIRNGSSFRRVADNCVQLHRYCREVGRKRTRMWTVVQKANFDELEQFPAFAAELGFERLTLSLDLNDFGQEDWKERNDQIDMHRHFSIERARQLEKLGRDCGVEVTFWFIDRKYSLANVEELCPWPFQRLYISSDMRVVPCCMISNPEVFDLGDARNLREVWNSEAMIRFRKSHLEAEIPAVCRSCYMIRS